MSPTSPPPGSPPPTVPPAPIRRFRKAVLELVRRESLLPAGGRVVVGVSGGPDSMALLRVLLDLRGELGIVVAAAHLDHATRPGSAEDARFVREWANRWSVDLVAERLEPGRGREAGSGGAATSEAALREARYEFLLRVARARDAIVAVGHHAEDRLETFLAQLIRGAGPRGLSLPRARREDGVVRPLLERSRAEILAFLEASEVPWRCDPTNDDGGNLRSRLRGEVVPLLRRENPRIADVVGRTASLMAAVDDLLTGEAARALDRLLRHEAPGELVLDGPSGRAYHPLVLSALLRESVRRLGGDPGVAGFDPFDRLVRAWGEGASCALDSPGGFRVEVGPSSVAVTRSGASPGSPVERILPVPGEITWPGGHPESPGSRVHLTASAVDPPPDPRSRSGPGRAWLDADRVVGELRVRGRRAGDRYRPLGGSGSTKVQDLLVDRKVPRPWRDRVPLVVDAAGILWIPGFRIDDRARITGRTTRALCLSADDPSPEGGSALNPRPDRADDSGEE